MKSDPNQRYQSCGELLRDLQAIQNTGRVIPGEKRMQLVCFFLCVAMTVLFAAGAIAAKTAKGRFLRQQPPVAASEAKEAEDVSDRQEPEDEFPGSNADTGEARQEADAALASQEAEETSAREKSEDSSAPQEDESVPEREVEEPEDRSAPGILIRAEMSAPETTSQPQEGEDNSSAESVRGGGRRPMTR